MCLWEHFCHKSWINDSLNCVCRNAVVMTAEIGAYVSVGMLFCDN
jgi:hypothetical protein